MKKKKKNENNEKKKKKTANTTFILNVIKPVVALIRMCSYISFLAIFLQ